MRISDNGMTIMSSDFDFLGVQILTILSLGVGSPHHSFKSRVPVPNEAQILQILPDQPSLTLLHLTRPAAI
jgi:hypothetical protein